MGVVSFTKMGSFKNLEKFLKTMKTFSAEDILNSYGQKGVSMLQSATPVDSGISAASWSFTTEATRSSWSITWTNSSVTRDGIPIVILLQFGHGTGTGGYVQGYDFINPALRAVFDKLADDVWKAVQNA